MPKSTRVYLGLGSNLGDRRHWLRFGIAGLPGVTSVSPVYETDPVGGPEQDDYLNIVICLETVLDPFELLEITQALETEAGRTRDVLNGPRTLDIDILLFGDLNLNEENLVIPHPRMLQRNFVMQPLLEIYPEFESDAVFIEFNKSSSPEGEVRKLSAL